MLGFIKERPASPAYSAVALAAATVVMTTGSASVAAEPGESQPYYQRLIEAVVDEEPEMLLELEPSDHEGTEEYDGEYVQLLSLVATQVQEFDLGIRAYESSEVVVDDRAGTDGQEVIERRLTVDSVPGELDELARFVKHLDDRSEPIFVRRAELRRMDDGYRLQMVVSTYSTRQGDTYHQQGLEQRAPRPRVRPLQKRLFEIFSDGPSAHLDRLEIDTERQLVVVVGVTDGPRSVDEIVEQVEQFQCIENVDLERAQVMSDDELHFEFRIATGCS